MDLGFTGTRKGMTWDQEQAVQFFLWCVVADGEWPAGTITFHHGDCVGADAQAHALLQRAFPDIAIHLHPPRTPALRAWCSGAAVVHAEQDFLVRNHAIVDACAVLLATPETAHEVQRSGTWATVRYARKVGRDVRIMTPQGRIVTAGWR
jgi:hypothetical protein